MAQKKLNEEQTVNEVQFTDLYKQASSVQVKIIELASNAVAFSDQEIKRAVILLRNQAQVMISLMDKKMPGQNAHGDMNDTEGEGGEMIDGGRDGKIIEAKESDIAKDKVADKPWEVKSQKDEKVEKVEESYTIDLKKPYSEVCDKPMTEAAFNSFKNGIITILESHKTGVRSEFGNKNAIKFSILINEVKKANPKSFDKTMDAFYDFADANSIEIK